MRIKTSIVVCYACLSLFAFRWEPVSCFESMALAFYKPWECVWDQLPVERFPEAWSITESEPLGMEPDLQEQSLSDVGWWHAVFPSQQLLRGLTPVAGRSIAPIKADQSRISYYLDCVDWIEPGDPVALGDALMGFVSAKDPDSSTITVVLLRHHASSPLLGEVRGTVAGKSVFFIVGGPSPGLTGCIDVQFPSSRFGLNNGSRAYSREQAATGNIPSGFLLGQIRLGRPKLGELQEEVALQPPFETWELERVVVLIPSDRLDWDHRQARIPPVPLERIPVEVSIMPGGSAPRPLFRVSAGMEEGLMPGQLLIRHETSVARLKQVGLFSSSAEFLISPGEEVTAALLRDKEPGRIFRMRAERQQGFEFAFSFVGPPLELRAGDPIYLAQQPCSGLEAYPAFLVEDPGDGSGFMAVVPWSWVRDELSCLRIITHREQAGLHE